MSEERPFTLGKGARCGTEPAACTGNRKPRETPRLTTMTELINRSIVGLATQPSAGEEEWRQVQPRRGGLPRVRSRLTVGRAGIERGACPSDPSGRRLPSNSDRQTISRLVPKKYGTYTILVPEEIQINTLNVPREDDERDKEIRRECKNKTGQAKERNTNIRVRKGDAHSTEEGNLRCSGKRPSRSGKSEQAKEPKSARKDRLIVLQLNVQGIEKIRHMDARTVLNDREVDVACVQECLFKTKGNLHLPGYTMYKCSCQQGGKCRGLATFVKNKITARVENLSCKSGTDAQEIKLCKGGTNYTIYNVYQPPSDKQCTLPIGDDVTKAHNNTIITGDFNAHSPNWGYENRDEVGRWVEDLTSSQNFTCMVDNESEPTFLHARGGTYRPDLTIVSDDIAPSTELEILGDVGSDHLPTLITIRGSNGNDQPTRDLARWNFKKANWERFTAELEAVFDCLEPAASVEESISTFNNVVTRAAKRAVPRGRIPKYKPGLTKEVRMAVQKRQKARTNAHRKGTAKAYHGYILAKRAAKKAEMEANKTAWIETVEALDNNSGANEWKLVNKLRKAGRAPQVPIKDPQQGVIWSDRTAAKTMLRHFTRRSTAGSNKKRVNEIKRERQQQEKELRKTAKPLGGKFEESFRINELNRAIAKSKASKSPGLDRIHNEFLRKLGPKARKHLLAIINLSWESGEIPKEWKVALIVPIAKKGKILSSTSGYRPVSLTSCVCKTVERMVNERLYTYLETGGRLDPNQFGFRKKRQPIDAVVAFTESVIAGFHEQKHTRAAFLDLSAAYDCVHRPALLVKLLELGVGGKMYEWIKHFLTDRTARVRFRGKESGTSTLAQGLPQGSALSCTLFLVYMNDIQKEIETKYAIYADDILVWAQNRDYEQACSDLQATLDKVQNYCDRWLLKLNAEKSVSATFSNSNKILTTTRDVSLAGTVIPWLKNPRYLGVDLDPRLTMESQCKKLIQTGMARLGILSHLASTKWGAGPKVIRKLYFGLVRSALDYSLPIMTLASERTCAKLDVVQSTAARLIAGCLKTTPVAAVEDLCQLEPLTVRRKRLLGETFLKYRAMPEGDVLHTLAKGKMYRPRLLKQSCRALADEILKENGITQDIRTGYVLPLHLREEDFPIPSVSTTIDGIGTKAEQHSYALRALSLERIDESGPGVTRAFTDGSKLSEEERVGYGAVIVEDGTITKELKGRGEFGEGSFDAECQAILETLHILLEREECRKRVIIYSDCRSALQALSNAYRSENPRIVEICVLTGRLEAERETRVHFQWIPSHVGIKYNEKADNLAKEGALGDELGRERRATRDGNQGGVQTRLVGLPRAREMLRQKIGRATFPERAGTNMPSGRSARSLLVGKQYNTLKQRAQRLGKDHWLHLRRGDAVLVARLRTGHVPVAQYLERFGLMSSSLCRLCGETTETISHILLECPEMDGERKKYKENVIDVVDWLYGKPGSLTGTATYFRHWLKRVPWDISLEFPAGETQA